MAQVYSVEHDADWHERVRHEVSHRANVELVLAAPLERADDGSPPALSSVYPDHDFTAYATTIDRFGDGQLGLVLVDGRARVACARRAYTKVAPGGFLILDNSERPDYGPIFDDLGRLGWRHRNYFGVGP